MRVDLGAKAWWVGAGVLADFGKEQSVKTRTLGTTGAGTCRRH